MRTFHRALRVWAIITLFFFCWSFLPLWQAVAWAAEIKQETGISSQKSGGKQKADTSSQTTGDRFEKALEAIRENISKSGDKTAKGEDDTREREAIKAKRAEIESADVDFKKEFAATEKKLKDAKLPKEILDRHAKFVKHYEDNLKELKINLDDVEHAKTKSDRRAKIEKTRLHLEKVKAPSKHKKLDPNNLSFRARKAGKKVAPRLKKEQFEKDFPPQRAPRTADLEKFYNFAFRNSNSALYQRPILLAYNETAGDIPLSLGAQSAPQQFALADSASFLIAQATGQPSADDLAETPDVQFTDAIRAKAQELGGKPVNIYNWVRNNIEYAPTYGSIQGSDMCLQSKICNDMDTASLLIALLRVSGISAHYAYGTIELPIDKTMNWVGGVTDPNMAGTVLATNGIPATALISGGTITAIQLEHVWVKAYIDYLPSRGAVQRQGNTWIPLDASFKQYTYTQGINIQSVVPFDAQLFTNQIQSTATMNQTDGSVTNFNSTITQSGMTNYATTLRNYFTQNMPNVSIGDVIGKKDIIQQNYPILLGTLPYKTVQVGSEFSQVPDNIREIISFSIPDPTGASNGLSYTTSLPQITGEKITLSFLPATASDEAIIESYLPKPHFDGTPVQLSELPTSFPAYLINIKPELRIAGQVVATGSASTMGSQQLFTISLNEPGLGMSNINNTINAGEYFGIGLDTGRIGVGKFTALKAKIEDTWAKLAAQNLDSLTKDDIVGDLFYATITYYFTELDMMDEISAKATNVLRYRVPSLGMFSLSMKTIDVFGIPTNARSDSLLMDVDRIMQAVFSKDGDMSKVKQFMLSSGLLSSALEHAVPEQLFSTSDTSPQGLSAVKAIKIANDQGIPIYTINQTNINVILPQLQINSDAITDIQNAVNAGKEVIVSRTNVVLDNWVGCGYMIIDPITGAGAYLISGGTNGMKLLGGVLLALSIMFFILAVMTAAPTGGLGAVIFGWFGIMALCGMNIVLSGKQKADEFSECASEAILTHFALDIMGVEELPYNLGVIGALLWSVKELKQCVQKLQSLEPPVADPLNFNIA